MTEREGEVSPSHDTKIRSCVKFLPFMLSARPSSRQHCCLMLVIRSALIEKHSDQKRLWLLIDFTEITHCPLDGSTRSYLVWVNDGQESPKVLNTNRSVRCTRTIIISYGGERAGNRLHLQRVATAEFCFRTSLMLRLPINCQSWVALNGIGRECKWNAMK